MLKKITHQLNKHRINIFFAAVIVIMVGFSLYLYFSLEKSKTQHTLLQKVKNKLHVDYKTIQDELTKLKNEDQFVRNERLTKEIKDIEELYQKASLTYEEIVKLRESTTKIGDIDTQYAEVVSLLSERNASSASALLATLNKSITAKRQELASSFSIPDTVKINNAAPGSGYNRQAVQTDIGTFMVDIIAADLNSTRVIVDTASDSDCRNDCPVMSLGDYAARSGAYAGINGPYFCPAEYPSCADKKNSFDTLLMNKNKVYFNSDNNVYSTVPAVIFSGNSARFVSKSLEWGRDTGPDSVIASQPLLVFDGNITFGGDDEIKRAGKGSRSFIGSSDSTVYIGVVYNANVAEVARVLKTMGIKNALNLDSGGSTALWSNGRYLAGPGRNTPFGILFVRK